MKNHLMRALVFIVLGAALFTVSAVSKNSTVEKWSSFLFGLSLPLFVGGIVSLVHHFKKSKVSEKANC